MKKDIPELARLELTTENVFKLFNDCLATPESEKIVRSSFYDYSSSRKAPEVPFDVTILFKHKSLIKYYLGQLKGVHDNKIKMIPSDGLFNYKGEKWTNDNRALFSLYYLGVASASFPNFIDGEKYAVTNNLPLFFKAGLKPTLSPNDPNFNIKNAIYALKNLGIILPEEPTHID